jgi:hypothetical protein
VSLSDIKAGDRVTRMLGGEIPMKLTVTEVTLQVIFCWPWMFDRRTGAEIDEDLDWGPPPKRTGSFIKEEK